MLRNLFRFVWIAEIIQFFKGYKLFSAKLGSVECKGNLYLHVFTVSGKGIVILYTLAVNDKFGVFVLNHLPAYKLIRCADFQTL